MFREELCVSVRKIVLTVPCKEYSRKKESQEKSPDNDDLKDVTETHTGVSDVVHINLYEINISNPEILPVLLR